LREDRMGAGIHRLTHHSLLSGGRGMKCIIGLAVSLILVSAASAQMDHDTKVMPEATKAIAVIMPTKGNSIHGTVSFETTAEGVHIIVDVEGLTPGKHGFHVHQYGDVSAADGMSAGGHFNPSSMPHSGPMNGMRHAGDLGNLEAGEDGHAHLDRVDMVLKLDGPASVIGRSVVVHEKEDDLKTQPAGAAGARIGFGVIGIAK
jgi:superoxide dismutase, Cu-Zn family